MSNSQTQHLPNPQLPNPQLPQNSGYGQMQCSRCKRNIRSIKSFHFRKKLCTYCYDFLYVNIPCLDCFQDIEVQRQTKKIKQPHVCTVCKAQRMAQQNKTNQTRTLCSRTLYPCSTCASVHTLRCPFSHYTDLNLPSRIQRQRTANVRMFRSSECQDGFYFWHKFLFCSRACVQTCFRDTPLCVVCGEENQTRCRQCLIPVCTGCAQQWFVHNLCQQCFIDSYPTWTERQLQMEIIQARLKNYEQIFTSMNLSRQTQWKIAEFLACRY